MNAEPRSSNDPQGLRHRLPADALVSRYAPNEARKFLIRGYLMAAFCAIVLALALPIGIAAGTHWAWIALTVVIVGGLAVYALLAASGAKHSWGNDDRLAIAVSDEGVVLPLAGLILWSEIASIHITDIRVFTISKALRDWAFGNTDKSITVHVSDIDSVLARADERARYSLVIDTNAVSNGFAGAFGEHMHNPSFSDIVNALTAGAAQHGIRVTDSKLRVPQRRR